jgi:sugar/nucleoside kinase (ribokinase family)
VVAAQLERSAADVPEAYGDVRGWHLGLHPEEPDMAFLAGLRARGGLVSVEPFRPALRPLSPDVLRALLGATDVFSPNDAGAASLVGLGDPPEQARRLIASGASVVALRLGAAGSLAVDGASRRVVRVPAVPVEVADPVGAGNAYCGGFLAGWAETHDLAEAGACGAVSASFVVEQVGLPALTGELRARAHERLRALKGQVTE